MRCQQIQEMLSVYLDGELSSSQKKLIEHHMQTCTSCAALWAELQETVALVRSLPELTPPENFRSQLRQKLAAMSPPVAAAGVKRNIFHTTGIPWRKFIPAAAALILVLGVGSFFHFSNSRNVAPSQIVNKQQVQVADKQETATASSRRPLPAKGKTASDQFQVYKPDNTPSQPSTVSGGASASSGSRRLDTGKNETMHFMSINNAGIAGAPGSRETKTKQNHFGTKENDAALLAGTDKSVSPAAVAGAPAPATALDVTGAPKTVRQADVILQVNDRAQAGNEIDSLVQSYNGVINYDFARSTLTVLIPADSLQPFLSGLKALDRTAKIKVDERDVTKEYYETIDRLSALQRQHVNSQKYGAGQDNKSVLPAQDEIDRLKGQLQCLDDAVNRATVNISLN